MKDTINGHTDFYDFGYRMMRRFWGKGYATESGIAAFRYGTDTMQLKEIFAMTDVDNLASRRVLEKVGLKYIETFNYDAEPNWRSPGEPTTWYKWSK
jgi:RimJ/RimL family protein N-acetyltransferase